MKKLIAIAALGIVPLVSFGRPHGGFHHGPPPPMRGHHYHHFGPGRFWGGFAAGAALGTVVGTAISSPVVYSTPVVYAPPPPPPVPVATRVWIPSRVETRYDSWGRPYTVTIPGFWSYR